MNLKPKKKNVVKKKTIRSPLQHLNGAAAGTGSSISSSTTSSSRDGFPLSTKASKSVHYSNTARAAPSCSRSNKSVKVNRLRTIPLSLRRNSNTGSKQKKNLKEVKPTHVEQTCTPACNNKLVRLQEEDDSTSKSKNTPPVQISVSPEIHGGLSVSVNADATASCYGAGHLLSGVTDRRKCRPRGILAVGNKSGCINGENNADLNEFSTSTSSLILEPLKASMRWLCNNGDEKDIPGLFSHSSPSSSVQGIDYSICRTQKTRVAPPATPSCDDLQKGNNWSPFPIDSLCSDNVIQTPESDSIFNHHSKGDDHCSELQQFETDSAGDRCSIDCSSVKELFGSKLSISLRDGINEIEEEPNCFRYLSDDNDKDGNESFGFKATIFAESITIDGGSISDLFSRRSNRS